MKLLCLVRQTGTRLKQHSHTHCLSHPKNTTKTVVGLLVSLKTGQLYSVECKYNLCEIKVNIKMKCFRISGLGLMDFLRELCHSESSADILYMWPLINTLFNLRFLQLVLGLPMKEVVKSPVYHGATTETGNLACPHSKLRVKPGTFLLWRDSQ